MVFLNHGSFGSCPCWVLEQQRAIADRLEREPIRFIVEDLEAMLDRARTKLARFVNADPRGVVFVTNATAGVNAVVRSLAFRPGDELLTSNHEYNACNNALRFAAERSGAKVVSVDLPFPLPSVDAVANAILGAVTPRTRLALISHVTSPTGLVLPVERLVAELNRRGVESLVDGAHAPGMFPLDIRSINPTYYTGNCHKWLCSPKGAGFLYVREDRRADVRPCVISHGANSPRTDRSRYWLEFDYAGTTDFSAWLSVPLAIEYMDSLHPRGWTGVFEHNRSLALRGRELLCRELGAEPGAPAEMIGTLASVEIPARPASAPVPATRYHDPLQDRLIARRVQAPLYPFSGPRPGSPALPDRPRRLLRIACQMYNSIEQIAFLARVVKEELATERAGA